MKTYEALVKGETAPKSGIPESFRVLMKELQALSLDVNVINEDGYKIDLRQLEEAEKDSKVDVAEVEKSLDLGEEEATKKSVVEASPMVEETAEATEEVTETTEVTDPAEATEEPDDATEKAEEPIEEEEPAAEDETEELTEKTIDELEFTPRVMSSLKKHDIATVGDLVAKTESEIKNFSNLGEKSFQEIVDKVTELGLEFKEEQSLDAKKEAE